MLDTKFSKMENGRGWNYYSIFLLIFAILVFCSNPVDSWAKVTGKCDNCHTMHYSQDGGELKNPDPNGPFPTLLVTDCLGCHSALDASTWKNDNFGGAPVVFNKQGPPTYGAKATGDDQGQYHGLAGGNFYWVSGNFHPDPDSPENDNRGHNIFPDNPDNTHVDPFDPNGRGRAPGNTREVADCGLDPCHYNLDKPFISEYYTGLHKRQGCTACHMVDDAIGPKGFHHADDSDTVVGSERNDTDGYYRFLKGHGNYGVSGIEDPTWQLNPTSTEHNEYLGEVGGYNTAAWPIINNSMTSFCSGCHGNFHKQEENGKWVRHPSDALIKDSGEYADYNLYNPEAPVARQDLSSYSDPNNTAIRSIVTPGEDLVMCLSCHRPHGSPYPDMLRWNYTDMQAGSDNNTGGCFICHTTKYQKYQTGP